MLIQAQVDFITLLRGTGPVARVVLFLLLCFSIWSWGIILSKLLLLRRVNRESETFWRIFRKGISLSEISAASETLRFTPLVPMLNSAVPLLQPGVHKSQGSIVAKTASTATLQRTLQRSAAAELSGHEKRLTFLATTASVAPFIGLFGTVWGVLTSLRKPTVGLALNHHLP